MKESASIIPNSWFQTNEWNDEKRILFDFEKEKERKKIRFQRYESSVKLEASRELEFKKGESQLKNRRKISISPSSSLHLS